MIQKCTLTNTMVLYYYNAFNVSDIKRSLTLNANKRLILSLNDIILYYSDIQIYY
jgi:hypothetical protein